MSEHDRHGVEQPKRFDPARAARLDDPPRFIHLSLANVLALLDPPLCLQVRPRTSLAYLDHPLSRQRYCLVDKVGPETWRACQTV